MKELTKAEEQIMQALWRLKKAYLKEIVAALPEPRPAYTTVSTVIRVLVKKGFIAFETFGKSNRYHPAISKADYSKATLKGLFQRFFNGSPTMFTSFFTQNENLSLEDLTEMREIIEAQIQQKQENDQ